MRLGNKFPSMPELWFRFDHVMASDKVKLIDAPRIDEGAYFVNNL